MNNLFVFSFFFFELREGENFFGPMGISLLGSVPLIMRNVSAIRTSTDKKMYLGVNFKMVTYYDKLPHKRLNSF